MRRWALVAVSVVLLCGCASVTAPQPGLDSDEEADLKQYIADLNWQVTGLSDDLRPPPPRVTTVSPDDRVPAYVKCMNIAGFDNYRATGGGGFEIGDASMDDRTDAELIADYVCNLSFEVDGQYDGWLNSGQLGYIFDYYRDSLVPCLETLGYEVQDAPSRAEFIRTLGGWHPYFAVRESQQALFFDDARVIDECAPMPAGIPDLGYAHLWDN